MGRIEDLPPDRVATAVSKAVVDAVAAGGGVETVVERALWDAKRALGVEAAPTPRLAPSTPAGTPARPVVTEHDVIDVARDGGSELPVPPGAIVTPLARDTAKDRGIRLVEA